MHKYVTCPVLYFLFFSPLSTLSTLENWAGCAKASVCISRRPAFPTAQLSSPSILRVYWSKQNESQDGHIEVSCDWLRWYSTESKLLSKMTISSFFFFCLNMMHCSSTIHSSTPSGGGSQGCEEQDGVENLFLSLQWERENETEREKSPSIRPSIRVLSTHSSTPPTPGLLQCWSVSKRREEGRVQLIRDQWRSVSVLISDQEQWVGPAPPLPYTSPSPPPPHFNTYQSSRTCRQRCPPLALHCQRMMQQRHRRWPPPCTEGGGVTGAK